MANISPTEREHIQRVVMKAEQRIPYVIGKPFSRQMTSRTESQHSLEPIKLPVLNAEDTSSSEMHSVEDPVKKVGQYDSVVGNETTRAITTGPTALEEVKIALSTVTIGDQEVTDARLAIQDEQEINNEPTHTCEIEKHSLVPELLSDESKSGIYDHEVVHGHSILPEEYKISEFGEERLPSVQSPCDSELTNEQIEHLEKVAELAEREMGSAKFYLPESAVADVDTRRDRHGKETTKELGHFEEVAQGKFDNFPENIARCLPSNLSDDKQWVQTTSTHFPELSKRVFSFDDEKQIDHRKLFGAGPIAASETLSRVHDKRRESEIESSHSSELANVSVDLTQEELDHIKRVTMMAIKEESDNEAHTLPPTVFEKHSKGSTSEVKPFQSTTKDLDHSTGITEMKGLGESEQLKRADVLADSVELTQEELDHIKKITMMAMQEESDHGTYALPPALFEKPARVFYF
ncbi:hypothetical protein KIN20_022703 [Parelaphostrongylus tenuis]|uniref:Uncharacterized protein n=1 Tax=Parelaphostrongylus tenuis TaxID=148309 RepID=A0AAD5QUZ7_PARTN|nr:hypothetical protein KIN20_022703 [Parelaphostrongylus tenuis]